MSYAERLVALENKYGPQVVLQETYNQLYRIGSIGDLLDLVEDELHVDPSGQSVLPDA